MDDQARCPRCGSAEVHFRRVRQDFACDECEHTWKETGAGSDRAVRPLRIFLSYGHDHLAENAVVLKRDLEARGHDVWFDLERLKAGRDWERYIEQGLNTCDKMVLLMTPHSVRRRDTRDLASSDGYCLNEIARATAQNKIIIPVLLADIEEGAPTSICRIQYLDLREAVPFTRESGRYQAGFERLVRAVEDDDLDFGGSQARLQRLLRPLDFQADFARHLSGFLGRAWLMDEVHRWLRERPESRVFWLTGGPGVGKSAFACHLCHWRREVAASHLCVHGHDDKADPSRALLSIAYQLSQGLPEYGRRLEALHLEDEVWKNTQTLFDNLVLAPLSTGFPEPDGPKIVVLDAIDEATRGGRNAIAELVRDLWVKTPRWLRLVITSRPESAVVTALSHLRPHVLSAQGEENLTDLRAFLERELGARGLATGRETIERVVDRSEGLFLYTRVFLEELDQGRLSLDRPEEYPAGLQGHYQRFFERQFPDPERYTAEIAPLVETLLARREPLPLGVLARAVGLDLATLRQRLARLGSLFPIIKARSGTRSSEGEADTVAPFHKSVGDWLTVVHEETGYFVADPYHADVAAGERRLAEACAAEVRSDPARASAYTLRHLPAHLVACGRGEEAARVLTDFGYHHARLETLGPEEVTNVLADFASVSADSSTSELAEWQRFFGENAHLLRRNVPGLRPEVYLLQLSYAHADDSPVTRAAEQWLARVGPETTWLRRVGRPRQVVRSACLRTLEGHSNLVDSVALDPSGRRAVSGSYDETLKVWDLETGACQATWVADSGVPCCAASATRFALGTDGGDVISLELLPPGPRRPAE